MRSYAVKLNHFPRCDEYLLNSAQNVKYNHWTMKCRSEWPQLYEIIHGVRLTSYAKYDVNPMNSAGDTRQSRWTMKYRSQ